MGRPALGLRLESVATRAFLPCCAGLTAVSIHDMWFWHEIASWTWLWMSLMWVIVLLLVAWGIRLTAGRTEDPGQRGPAKPFARGEIDIVEYEERRNAFDSSRR